MKIPITRKKAYGIIAILDALGASTFRSDEIDNFLKARERTLRRLIQRLNRPRRAKQNTSKNWKPEQFSFFTFNDTILMAFRADQRGLSDQQINYFFRLVRQLFVDSLGSGILFRGACATCSFLVDEATNTILGEAVSDAAGWYDKADWIGLITTPRTTLHLRERIEASPKRTFRCRDYSVPMRNGQPVLLKALDWRNALSDSPFKSELAGQSERKWFLHCLASHSFPHGTESKYFNSLAFFDACGGTVLETRA